MNAVERVIFDVLARRGSVALPGVGSLEVKRRKAHRVSETRVIPPQNVVVFTHDEPREITSVVDLLNRKAAMSMDDAWAAYNEWIGEARADGTLIIEGVGTVRNERFEPTDNLHEMLNPTGTPDEASGDSTGEAYGSHGSRGSRSGGGHGEGYGEGVYGDGVYGERRRKCKCWPWWAWVLCALGAFFLYIVGLLVFSEEARRSFMEGVNWSYRPKTGAVVEPAVVPTADTVRMAEPIAVAPAGPVFHVIAGAFLEPGNAEKRMAELRRDYPGMTVVKVQNPNGYEMVSVFSSIVEADAYRTLNRNLDIDPCMWVYKE